MNMEMNNKLLDISELIDGGKISLAHKMLNELLDVYPDQGIILFYMGKLYAICKDEELALDFYRKAEILNYDSTELYISMALIYQILGMRIESEEYFIKADTAANKSEDRWIVLSALAMFYLECEKYLKAEKVKKRLLREFPNNYQGYHIHILLLIAKNKFEDALIYIKKVPNCFQSHPQFLLDYIQIYRVWGKNEELHNLFEKDDRFKKYVPQEVLKEKLKFITDIDEKEKIIMVLAHDYKDSDAVISLMVLKFAQENYKESAEIANVVLEQEVKNQGIKYYLALYFQIYNLYFLSEKKPSEELRKWIETAGNWCIRFVEEMNLDQDSDIVRNSITELFAELNKNLNNM